MRTLALLLVLTCVAFCSPASKTLQTTNGYLTERDRIHLEKVLQAGLNLTDVPNVYHAVLGYKFLGIHVPNIQAVCNYIASSSKDTSNLTHEKAFYITVTWKLLGESCKSGVAVGNLKNLMGDIIIEPSAIGDMYFRVVGLAALSEKLPRDMADKVAKAVQAGLKKDDSLWNLAYAFHIASALDTAGAFALERVEDAMVQADEVDNQHLQFEGGLSLTSFLIDGIFKLSAALKEKPSLTADQTIKLSNYLLSRRTVQTTKGAASLLTALTAIANDPYKGPICVTLPEGQVSVSREQPHLTVKVCDILGNPLPSEPRVVASTVTKVIDGTVTPIHKNVLPSVSDKTLFQMNLMNLNLGRGFYKASINVSTANDQVVSNVVVKVLRDVTVRYLLVGTGDADQTTQPKLTRVPFPEKLSRKIEADSQQKLVMRFLLEDSDSKEPLRAHQAFVRLSSVAESNRGHEIIFVAEGVDPTQVYRFDMPVATAAGNFDYRSGDYNIELIIGDATLNNPFQWTIATVALKFPESASHPNSDSKEKSSTIYTAKPEIKHMFREPEKRPPAFVSNLFTGLCLAPILLLVILWAKLGVNISNFPLSVSAFIFHLGLGSIFVLFGVFWLRLNIFVTLRYLLGLGIVTFLAGNKMLSRIAHRHKLSR